MTNDATYSEPPPIKSKRTIFVIERYIGFINGRALFKIKDIKHDIMTKRITHVDIISGVVLTSESIYIIEEDGIMSHNELMEIYCDICEGKNKLRFIIPERLEAPSLSMLERFL